MPRYLEASIFAIKYPQFTRFNRTANSIAAFESCRPLSGSQLHTTASQCITAAEKPLPQQEGAMKSNQEQLPHVTEEAETMSNIKGEQGPELQQGSPVQDILKKKDISGANIPQILRKSHKHDLSNRRDFCTSKSPQASDTVSILPKYPAGFAMASVEPNKTLDVYKAERERPKLPLESRLHTKYRSDPLVKQFTGLLMTDGKLGHAEKTIALILERLRRLPPPSNLSQSLVPCSTPFHQLTLDPVKYIMLAVDSVAPLFRLRSQRGLAGGGVALQIPVPLRQRQRRRRAILWILDAAAKRRSNGAGRTMFANNVADEILSTLEGRSSAWEKRSAINRLGVAARANLFSMAGRR